MVWNRRSRSDGLWIRSGCSFCVLRSAHEHPRIWRIDLRCQCVIHQHIHVPFVDLVDRPPPVVQRSVMHVEESGIDRRVPIVGPGQVHQVRSGEVDDLLGLAMEAFWSWTSTNLESHSLNIVQCIYQPFQVTTVAHLVGVDDMLKGGPVDIVICRVAVGYTV